MSRKSKSSAKRAERQAESAINRGVTPRWLSILEAHPWIVIGLLTAVCLLPFVTKPFHLDDPMYLWAGEHIHSHPFDPYGFDVFWSGRTLPMHVVMQNPPLASYYIAAVTAITGVHEVPLHLAFFVPALFLAFGVYALARNMCSYPALAAILAVVTPAFVVSGTTIMCDILMTCFWVWAVYWWDRGLRASHWPCLAVGAALVGCAFVSKYPGINCLPLLAAYTIARRAPWRYILFLLIPIGVVIAYEAASSSLYGRGFLSQAGSYVSTSREVRGSGLDVKLLIALAFTGACMLPAVLLAPLLWRVQALILGVGVWIGTLLLLTNIDSTSISQLRIDGKIHWALIIQMSLWITAGASILVLTVADVWKWRNAESLLLALWIIGTFAFAGVVNWSVNARTILPMAPAVAILIVRRFELMRPTVKPALPRILAPAAVAASLVISILVAYADAGLARSARLAAESLCASYGDNRLHFQGHWGFQQYIQAGGARPFELLKTPVQEGDLVVIPQFNSNVVQLGPDVATKVDTLLERSVPWLTTMNRFVGAGFYSDSAGPIPFYFGRVPMEKYEIVSIDVAFDPAEHERRKSSTAPAP